MHTCIVWAAIQPIIHDAYMLAAMLCICHENCSCKLYAEHCYRKLRDQIHRKRGGNVHMLLKAPQLLMTCMHADSETNEKKSTVIIYSSGVVFLVYILHAAFHFPAKFM